MHMVQHAEREHRSLVEKGIWWAEIGGIVAAVIGVVRAIPDLAVGGAGIAVVSYLAGNEIYKRKSAGNPQRD